MREEEIEELMKKLDDKEKHEVISYLYFNLDSFLTMGLVSSFFALHNFLIFNLLSTGFFIFLSLILISLYTNKKKKIYDKIINKYFKIERKKR